MTKKTVIRVQKKPGQFAQIHKGFLSDDRLGLDAMGLMAWLLSKPDNWKPQVGHIATTTGTAFGRVRSSMQRLEECGYVRRSPIRDRRTGRIIRWDIVIFETPEAAQQAQDEQPSLFEQAEPKNNGRKKAEKEQKPHSERITPFAENPGGGELENGYPHDGNPFSGNQTLTRMSRTKNDFTKQQQATSASGDGDRLPGSAGGARLDVAPSQPPTPAGAVDGCGCVVVEGVEKIVLFCIGQQIARDVAERLVEEHGAEACSSAIACLKGYGRRPKNPAGFLVKAIRHGWKPAASARSHPVRSAIADPSAAVQAEQRREEQAMAEMELALAHLSDDEWSSEVEELRPRLGATILRFLADGRPPKTIKSLRIMIYERVKNCVSA